MSSTISKLLKDARREFTLEESGFEIRIIRAKVYEFLKLRVPMGNLLQGLTGAAWAFRKGEMLPDKLTAQINEASPTFADLCEKLIMECVFEIRAPGEQEWERIRVVENDRETIEEQGIVRVADFTMGLSLDDLSQLQSEIWSHNGLGKGVEAMLAPFREIGRAIDRPDGAGVPEAPDGDPGAGPDGLHAERGVPDSGGQRGGGGEAEGGSEGEAEAGAEVEGTDG